MDPSRKLRWQTRRQGRVQVELPGLAEPHGNAGVDQLVDAGEEEGGILPHRPSIRARFTSRAVPSKAPRAALHSDDSLLDRLL